MPIPNGDQPATRADVQALDAKVEGSLQQLEDKMNRGFVAVEDKVHRLDEKVDNVINELREAHRDLVERTQEFVRDAQTELLRGFEVFATAHHTRIRKVQADVSNIDAAADQHISALERRLLEIEMRWQILPPPA